MELTQTVAHTSELGGPSLQGVLHAPNLEERSQLATTKRNTISWRAAMSFFFLGILVSGVVITNHHP